MARRSTSRARSRSTSSRRGSYRSKAPRRSVRSRAAPRRSTRRGTSSARTIRIEIVQPGANPIARPDGVMVRDAGAPRKRMF